MSDPIDELIEREGGDKETNRPSDRGGRTRFGISERSNPQAWADGEVSREEARAIFETKYVKSPGFDKISDQRLREQLVDFGVNSGPALAVSKLQEILKVKIDGVLGPKTLAAINAEDPRWLANKLAVARIKMIGRLVKKDPTQLDNINGWLNRASEWIR